MRNDITTEAEPTPSILPPDTQQGDGRHHHRHPHAPRTLKIRHLPMRYGWYWLIEGFILWGRSPAFLSFLAFSCIFIIFAALNIPYYVGELIGPVLYPGLMLGVFNGCRAIDRKRNLNPALLLSGFRRHAFDLLLAGFCNFIVTTAVLLSTWPIDSGMAWRMVMYAEMPVSIPAPQFYLLPLMLSTLWGVMYLFVPQLIGWWRLSVPKALIFSLKGCLLNWLPFLAYAFCLGFFVIMLSALAINFFGLIDEGLGVVACAVFLLIASPALIASFYVAARDIFGFPRRRKHRRRRATPAQDAPQRIQA